MAAPKPVQVPCPDCGVPLEVPIKITSIPVTEPAVGCTVSLSPDLDQVAEHYALEHGAVSDGA